MAKEGFDVSELRSFASTIDAASVKAAPAVRDVVVKGAVKIKDEMRRQMAASRSFGALSRSINFDVIQDRDGVEAEIGPSKRSGAGAGLGFGANIAYFGTSRGGGTVADPQQALDQEIPHYEQALAEALGDLL